MQDFPSDDNLIYIIPANIKKPLSVVFENSVSEGRELNNSHIIGIDLSNDIDIQKCAKEIEKLFPSNSWNFLEFRI